MRRNTSSWVSSRNGSPTTIASRAWNFGDGGTSTPVSVNNCPVCSILMAYANDEQKQRFLKPLARGEMLGAFCLTEPQGGSDAAAMTTRARPTRWPRG